MLEHCSNCDKPVDTCGFYDNEEDKFLLDCDICKKSFCTHCAVCHEHFVFCNFCKFYHSEVNIAWCAIVDKYEQSSF